MPRRGFLSLTFKKKIDMNNENDHQKSSDTSMGYDTLLAAVNSVDENTIELLYEFKKLGGSLNYGSRYDRPLSVSNKNEYYRDGAYNDIPLSVFENVDLIHAAQKLLYSKDYIPKIKCPEQNLYDAEAMDIIEQILEDVVEIMSGRFNCRTKQITN